MERGLGAMALGVILLFTGACGSTGESLFEDDATGDEVNDGENPSFGPMGTAGYCARPAMLRASPGATARCADGHGGRARVVQAEVLGLVRTSLVDTGELPPEGGAIGRQLLHVEVPSVLRARAATANVWSSGSRTDAEAEVAALDANVLGIGISATVLRADARASCTAGGVDTAGASTIADLRVGGVRVDVTGEPNQTIEIDGILRVVINEQIEWPDGIRVRALHVTALGALRAADVIVASAEARVSCDGARTCSGGAGGSDPGHGKGGSGSGGNGGAGGSGSQGSGGSRPGSSWHEGAVSEGGGQRPPGAGGHDPAASSGSGHAGGLGDPCDARHVCAPDLVCVSERD